jgi:hypothetical protein
MALIGPLDAQDADDLAARINRYGFGDWLKTLLARLGQPTLPDGLAIARQRVEVAAPRLGLTLTLYRRPDAMGPTLPDGIVLERARFAASPSALPYALDARRETPASAATKLGANHTGPGNRISYFLADAKIVELSFADSGEGLQSVLLARLGVEEPGR